LKDFDESESEEEYFIALFNNTKLRIFNITVIGATKYIEQGKGCLR